MEHEYTVQAILEMKIAADSPSNAEEKVHEELNDAGQEVLQLVVESFPVVMCVATLRAVRETIAYEMGVVDKQLSKEYIWEPWNHMGGVVNRDDVREEIEKKKLTLIQILDKADKLLDTQQIYTVEATMTVDVFAESDGQALEGAAEELEKPWREIFELNIEEMRR